VSGAGVGQIEMLNEWRMQVQAAAYIAVSLSHVSAAVGSFGQWADMQSVRTL